MSGQRFRELDRSKLILAPLASRRHDFDASAILPLTPTPEVAPALAVMGARIRRAREAGAPVVLMMGAHVLRSGVQRYLIDLLRRDLVTCLALNGAGMIHDYELALIGATTESVSHYIKDGSFGMWRETSQINDIVARGAARGLGLGEAVGQAIAEDGLPHRAISVLAEAHRLGRLATVHVHLGCDIVHQHPNCDGAAYGATTYRDFLRLAAVLQELEGGVVMNFGSAVMAPEVYLKALSMARNLARQEDRQIAHFTTLVCDLAPLEGDWSQEAPKDHAQYYFRPWKTMLVRTVADGGESHYVRAKHSESLPQLWTALST